MQRRHTGESYQDYYVVSNDAEYKFNSALVQLFDKYEEKIDSLVDTIDTFAQAYELVNRQKDSMKRKLDYLEEENKNLNKRLKSFTRVSVPRGQKPSGAFHR